MSHIHPYGGSPGHPPPLSGVSLPSADLGDVGLRSFNPGMRERITEVVRLIDHGTGADFRRMLADGRALADAFAASFRTSEAYVPGVALESRLNAWFHSARGQEVAREVAGAATAVLSNSASVGHPGHDRRHVVVLDPLSGLRHCVEDQILDYRSLFLVGSLFHDVGRLPEPRVFGAPASGVAGVDHQYLSYELLKILLDGAPELPAEIRDSLLFSVLVHQAGKDHENLAAQMVQRADREQLVGPEFLFRATGCNVGYGRLSFKVPTDSARAVDLPLVGTAAETDVASHIEFYMRNLYQNIGVKGAEHVERLKVVSGAFLHLAHGEALAEQLFRPEMLRDGGQELAVGRFKKPLARDTWSAIRKELSGEVVNYARELASAYREMREDVTSLFLRPSGVPSFESSRSDELSPTSASMAQIISNRWGELTLTEQERWEQAFVYGAGMRVELFNELLFSVEHAPVLLNGNHPVLSVVRALVKSEIARGPNGSYA